MKVRGTGPYGQPIAGESRPDPASPRFPRTPGPVTLESGLLGRAIGIADPINGLKYCTKYWIGPSTPHGMGPPNMAAPDLLLPPLVPSADSCLWAGPIESICGSHTDTTIVTSNPSKLLICPYSTNSTRWRAAEEETSKDPSL